MREDVSRNLPEKRALLPKKKRLQSSFSCTQLTFMSTISILKSEGSLAHVPLHLEIIAKLDEQYEII